MISLQDMENNKTALSSLRAALALANEEERETCQGSDTSPLDYAGLLDCLWAVGNSHDTQSNMLFSYVGGATDDGVDGGLAMDPFVHSVKKGFQRALKDGPICQELMKNTAFVVHGIWEASDETMVGLIDFMIIPVNVASLSWRL